VFRLSVLVSVLFSCTLLSSCEEIKAPTLSEQNERTIRQEVKQNTKGLQALTAVGDTTEYDGFAWRRGEHIQIRQRKAHDLELLTDATAPEIIATAVKYNIPSFSIVRYNQGWLVVFRNYLSEHCQAVYAYAYNGSLDNTPQCSAEQFANNANGQCQSPIDENWVVFQEWFFAEALASEGNPVCQQKAAQGWHTDAISTNLVQ